MQTYDNEHLLGAGITSREMIGPRRRTRTYSDLTAYSAVLT
jgi:hypothetical protein